MAQPKHILSERLGDERILLDLKQQEYLSLNLSGALIWEGLEAGHSTGQIAQAVCAEFDADLLQVTVDIENFASELRTRGLAGG